MTYQNFAREPFPGTRAITFTVYDGIFSSNVARANLTLNLINDNLLTLTCGAESLLFEEGSVDPVPLTSQLTLVDLDQDHLILGATVELGPPQEGDELNLDLSAAPWLEITTLTNTSIQISGLASDDHYQVCHCYL